MSKWEEAKNDYTVALELASQEGSTPDPFIINSRGNCYNSLGMWKGEQLQCRIPVTVVCACADKLPRCPTIMICVCVSGVLVLMLANCSCSANSSHSQKLERTTSRARSCSSRHVGSKAGEVPRPHAWMVSVLCALHLLNAQSECSALHLDGCPCFYNGCA